MADKIIENNQVSVMGRIATGFTFSHQVFGEGFYMMDILVKRLSDSEDRIPACAFSLCPGSEVCGGGRRNCAGQSDLSGRIYL